MEIFVARLLLHLVKVYRASVNADRSTCLHASLPYPVAGDAFRQVKGGRLRTSSAGNLGAPYMHQAVEECAGGDDDAGRFETDVEQGAHAADDGASVR